MSSSSADQAYSELSFDGLVDEARGRRVPVTVLFPNRTDPPRSSPLIVLSHGAAAGRSSYAYLAKHLARNGYVVAISEHVGSSTKALLRGIFRQRSGPRRVSAEMARDRGEWQARPAGIRFVVDTAARWNETDPRLRNTIDLARIGVLGDSYGAYTALAVGGVGVRIGDSLSDFSNPRVDAMVALSPSGPGGWGGFSEESFARVEIPALLVTGSADVVTDWQWGEWRKLAYDLMPPGPRYFLWLEEATHFDFTDLPFKGSRSASVHRIVETMVLAFFDVHLKTESNSSMQRLNDGYAGSLSDLEIPEVRLYTRDVRDTRDTLGSAMRPGAGTPQRE